MSDAIETAVRALAQAIRDDLEKTHAKPSSQLSVADYAEHWNLSVSTVRLAIREKRLDVTRVGRAIRIAAGAQISQAVDDYTARARLVLMRGGKTR